MSAVRRCHEKYNRAGKRPTAVQRSPNRSNPKRFVLKVRAAPMLPGRTPGIGACAVKEINAATPVVAAIPIKGQNGCNRRCAA